MIKINCTSDGYKMIMNKDNQKVHDGTDAGESAFPYDVLDKNNEVGAYGLGFRAVRKCVAWKLGEWEVLDTCFTAQFAAEVTSIQDVTETPLYQEIFRAKYVP